MGCRIQNLQVTLWVRYLVMCFHVSGIKTLKSNVLCSVCLFALCTCGIIFYYSIWEAVLGYCWLISSVCHYLPCQLLTLRHPRTDLRSVPMLKIRNEDCHIKVKWLLVDVFKHRAKNSLCWTQRWLKATTLYDLSNLDWNMGHNLWSVLYIDVL